MSNHLRFYMSCFRKCDTYNYLKEGSKMYEDFFSERLAQLRESKNVSAREMSLAIGQNESYINRIENKKSYPSMQVFFYICEYLQITPQEFFNETSTFVEASQSTNEISTFVEDTEKLTPFQLTIISALVKELVKYQQP